MKRETTSERKRGKRRRENYVRENVIECTHTSKHICVNSLVNNLKYNSCVWRYSTVCLTVCHLYMKLIAIEITSQ